MIPAIKFFTLSRIVLFSLLFQHTEHILAMPQTQLGLARPICCFCDDLSALPGVEFPSELRHKFFHRECSTCEPRQDRNLCNFCQHLRIRHLFFCDLNSESWDELSSAGIRQFDLNISPSQSCPLCQLLISIINREKPDPVGNKERDNKPCKNAYLRLIWDRKDGMNLGICVSSVFYPILLHEKLCEWETFKRQAPRSARHVSHDSAPLHVGKKVRWDQVRRWLEESANPVDKCWCWEEPPELDEQLKRLPDGFMLIDVKERKIVPGDQGCQFVALSYVWGNNPDNKLSATNETIGRLRCRNGVSAHELPATIEDAIQICIELGEQYLWVDRLCIIQDHHENKQHQINRMASIYASASFVIVVTEGDMESGVAGVRHERPVQDIRFFSGSTFSHGYPSIEDVVGHSRWATRGWTYQEAVLAWKKLFFTPSQVYYTRGSNIRSEHIDRLQKRLEPFEEMTLELLPGGFRCWEKSTLYLAWGHHLEAYTARSLSHSSDIYNAFMGFCSAFYDEEDPSLCGLPRRVFDQALLWSCVTPAENVPPHKIRTPEKGEDLPSWSWASVIGKVSLYGNAAMDRRFCGSLVEWAVKRSGKSHPEPWPFHQLNNYRNNKFLEFKRIIEALHASALDASVDSLVRDNPQGWYEDMDQELRNALLKNLPWVRDDDMDEELEDGLLKNLWLRDKTLLVSRAPTARFRLKKHRPHSIQYYTFMRGRKHYFLEVVNEEGDCIGMLSESEPRVEDEVLPYLSDIYTFEFVALSISDWDETDFTMQCVLQRDEELIKDWKYWENYIHSGDRHKLEAARGILWQKSRNLTFYDRGYPLQPIPVVNVMLIGRDRRHSLLAHRISIGWILLSHWVKVEQQFKTIVLE